MSRLLLVAAVAGVGVVGSVQSTAAAPVRFFSRFPGPHRAGALLINETAGTVGSIALGEPVEKATHPLGTKYRWSGVRGADVYYCANPSPKACGPPFLHFWAPQTFTSSGPGSLSLNTRGVAAIDLWGGRGNPPAGEDAVTLRGIHIGSTMAAVRRAYRVVRGKKSCYTADDGSPFIDYYAQAGGNTLLFMPDRGRVIRIALTRGTKLDC